MNQVGAALFPFFKLFFYQFTFPSFPFILIFFLFLINNHDLKIASLKTKFLLTDSVCLHRKTPN